MDNPREKLEQWLKSRMELTDGQCRDIVDNAERIFGAKGLVAINDEAMKRYLLSDDTDGCLLDILSPDIIACDCGSCKINYVVIAKHLSKAICARFGSPKIDVKSASELKTIIVESGYKDLTEEADCMGLAIFIQQAVLRAGKGDSNEKV